MKLVFTTIFIMLLSGCTLSQGHHFVVDSPVADKMHDPCGYHSTALPIGPKNKATIETDNFHFDLCAIDYRTRIVAAGFIIPFIPLFKDYRQRHDIGWVKVTNLHTESALIIDTGFTDDPAVREQARFNRSFYPDSGASLGTFTQPTISIATGSSAWIGLPLSTQPSVKFQSGDSSTAVDFKSASSFGWAMITR